MIKYIGLRIITGLVVCYGLSGCKPMGLKPTPASEKAAFEVIKPLRESDDLRARRQQERAAAAAAVAILGHSAPQ